MKAFDLELLIDLKFMRSVLGAAFVGRSEARAAAPELLELRRRWRVMTTCVKPITSLTIPAELQSKDASEHLLGIDITDRPEVTIGALMEVLKATAALYESVGKVYGYSSDQPLTVVKLESGTTITLSFKGVADTVRELKNLLIEMWNKYRHRKPDEIIHHNQALDSTIDILTKIEDRVKKRSLSPEEAQRLKRMALNSTASLFKEGALLTAIPSIELVDNYKLLDGFTAPKLLSAPVSSIV